MKSLLCHCRNYRSEVKALATTPIGIRPESVKEKITEASDAIIILLTVEVDDLPSVQIPELAKEVRKMCKDTGHQSVVIFPFGHLSNKLAKSELVIESLDLLELILTDLNPKRVHFGSDKKLLLDIFGHKGNVRYREF